MILQHTDIINNNKCQNNSVKVFFLTYSIESWADLAYEQSDSDSDLEDNTLTILKT